MKRLILLAPIALLAACGAPRQPDSAAAAAESAEQPMVYVSSRHAAGTIASCLDRRLSRVHASRSNGVTDITVGSASNGSYFVTLTPSNGGSVVKVVRGTASEPPEEEMRFVIARCAT